MSRTSQGPGFGVEGAEAFEVGKALGEERHENPAHQQHFAAGPIARMADDGLVRGGCDVVAGQHLGRA